METYQTENIRNVALISHTGAGKTTLAESFLFHTGVTTRMGKVEDGNTVSDYEPEEAKRAGSIHLSIIPVEWNGTKINLLDTPGYLDFIGDALSGLSVADAALLLVDASSADIEVGAEMMWKRAEQQELPRLILINKMDRENADFGQALDLLRARFGKSCVPYIIPIGAEHDFNGVIHLLKQKAIVDGATTEIPTDLQSDVDTYREQLVETIAEVDDDLMLKYLEGEELSAEELTTALVQGVRDGKIVPVLAGSALNADLAPPVLDTLASLVPPPNDRPPVLVNTAKDGEMELVQDSEGPLAALVFKTTADPFVGKLSFFRVYSGTFTTDVQAWSAPEWQAERIHGLFVPRGKSQEPVDTLFTGDIGGVAKMSVTATGHTLTTREPGIAMNGVEFPEPVYSVALHAKAKADQDKMGAALARIVEEDPALTLNRDIDTGETVLSGMGDVHIDVTIEALHRKFGVDISADLPKVPYRETIANPMKAEYKHKKQSGGHGQYGHVALELIPLERGTGFQFVDKVVGGSVPRNYIAAVEKGIRETLDEGAIAGYPIVDVQATLYDGSSHPVDSSDMAFKIAASMAFRQGMTEARAALLEPIMEVKITVPDDFTGDVIGDLNGKRAHVHGMMPEGGITVVDAEAPLAEMQRYATTLRSMTQGRGLFSMKFLRYDEVPEHLKEKVVEETKAE